MKCSYVATFCLLFSVLLMPLLGQEPRLLTQQERSDLIAERDAQRREAMQLAGEGKFDEAVKILDQVLETETSVFGEAHEEPLSTLRYQARLAHLAKDWEREVVYRRRAFKIGNTIYNKDAYQFRDLRLELKESEINADRSDEQHQKLVKADIADKQANDFWGSGQYTKAAAFAKRRTEILEQVLGREHPKYGASVNRLAEIYRAMGDYSRAEPLYREAIKISREKLGENHPSYGSTLNNLGLMYAEMGNYTRAEPLYIEALNIRRDAYGKEHPVCATTLNNLGLMYTSMGDYQRAKTSFIESTVIRKKVLGEEHPYYAQSLNNLGMLCHHLGDYAQAKQLYVKAKSIREEVLGRQHPDYAQSLNNLAELYRLTGDFRRAEPLYIEAKAIQKELYGKEHPHYASTLCNLALLYQAKAEYTRAKPLFIESLELRERLLGKENPVYALALNNLALCYESMGDYSEAESHYLEAKSIRGRVLGKQHPYYATSLMNLGGLYIATGNYPQAETLLLEAQAILDKALGREHPYSTQCLNSLGLLYTSIGDFAKAESRYLAAKEINERVNGKLHPDYALTLNNLAALYDRSMRDFARAEPLYLETKSIQEEVLGKEHPDYALTLTNLAIVYESMGDFSRAERLYVQGKDIRKRVLGEEHPDYARSLDELAGLYIARGDYALAEPLLIESRAIRERVLGSEHPDLAESLNSLAVLHAAMGDYDKAQPLAVSANAIDEKALGQLHPEYASGLNNLATIFLANGDFARAESSLVKAKTIREKVLGKEHPDYARSLNSMAFLLAAKGDYALAAPLYQGAVDLTLRHLERVSYIQSEQQQLLMNRAVRRYLDHYLSCCIKGDLNSRAVIERLMKWKGTVLRRGRGLRLAAQDPAIAQQFGQLRAVASQISATMRDVPKPDELTAWRTQLESLGEQQRMLEADLMSQSLTFRDAKQEISLDQIRLSIPVSGVLVDFVEYRSDREKRLAASVIHQEGDTVLVDLGPMEEIGKAIGTWRNSFGQSNDGQAAGVILRQRLWEPLLDYIEGADPILVSSDGVLGRLPLNALPGSKPGSYLIEDHRVHMVPVPQLLPDLIKKVDENEQLAAHTLLVVGSVDYDSQHTVESSKLGHTQEISSATQASSGQNWPKLEQTGREVDFIKNLFQQTRHVEEDAVIDLRDATATESAFRARAPNCRLLHLATHGFFASPEKKNALSSDMNTEAQNLMRVGEQRERIVGFSPGQLSGLVFAGANRPPHSLGSLEDDVESDDGIMTADEIAYLPLDGVELAVLSACETGLGEVAGGEGLLGIQRAFQMSGVDSVVATMWQVDDMMTRVLMERFYTNLFEKKMSKLDALREAQLSLLNAQKLDAATLRGLGTKAVKIDPAGVLPSNQKQRLSPRFWAPFVLSGAWR